MMALPTSIKDANGTITQNVYDANNRVSKTTVANSASVEYSYSNGNLETATRTNETGITQTYSFEYDAFGNMRKLKVGSDVLATYDYNSGNGLLQKETYANGDWVSYSYDTLGRTTETRYSDGRTIAYVYNGEGRLHSLTESSSVGTTTHLYTYDSIGRLIFSQQNDGNTIVLLTHQSYNENNQLTGESWQMGAETYSQNYKYNSQSGSLSEASIGTGDTLTMGYDELQRLVSVNGKFSQSYTYKDIDNTKTTTQVSNLSYSGLANSLNFGYTYDAVGNIFQYTAPDGEKTTYTYDAQGQLLKAVGDETYT